jgi:hypothetical protein
MELFDATVISGSRTYLGQPHHIVSIDIKFRPEIIYIP